MKTSSGDRYVAKKLIYSQNVEKDRMNLKLDILTQCVAQFFAEQFNAKNPPKTVNYIPCKLMYVPETKEILAVK